MITFASELKNILSKTEIKSSTIAEAVQYDGSYISKWLSGRISPSERYINKIAAQIAQCVVAESSATSIIDLCEAYNTNPDGLENTIMERLSSAYRGENKTVQEIRFQADSILLLVIKSIPWSGKTTVIADLFAMEHESRLLFAGIHNGRFVDRGLPVIKMVVNVNSITDPVYDPIFLVHMLTAHSSANIGLFHNPFAADKLLYADEKQFVSAILTDDSHCISVTKQENPVAATQLRHNLNIYCTQETILVQRVDSLFNEHLYMHSLLSSDHQWLTGHFTEQMIPQDLYAELCEGQDNVELYRIGGLLQKCLPELLVYRSAFSKLIISGELDFFNQKVILTPEQQMKSVIYVRGLADRGCVRIVDGGFSTDFQYITDPCVFISDTVVYLRLENGKYEKNLLNITDKKLKAVYKAFFRKVWDENPLVIREKEEVLRMMDTYASHLKQCSDC